MTEVRLRPYRAEDATRFDEHLAQPGAIDFFHWAPSDAFARKLQQDGMATVDHGNLVVEVEGVGAVGDVGWTTVHRGPLPHGEAFNIGVGLFPEHRGHGYGTVAQRLLAEYLFSATRIERLEASTDVLNVAEQRSLEKAGFAREGVLRHAQWRAGAFHDVVLYSRLRDD